MSPEMSVREEMKLISRSLDLHLTLPGKRKKNNEIEIQVANTGTEKPVESRDGTGKGIETFNLMTFTEEFSD
jgi:hypothetical protein